MLSSVDIESLGFKQYVDLKDTLNSYRLRINNNIFNLRISIYRDNIITISKVVDEFNDFTLFVGVIDNKSDLEVILKCIIRE